MRTVKVAFDVDGTLRCNCTETCEDPNQRIVDLFKILASFKNVELFVWSCGGARYAERFADKFGLNVAASHCLSKFGALAMDLCIDDIQDTDLATINLIVREK
ncbi:hypothetical protein [Rhodococcus sp. RCBS9]|uniref:hypothetical protein n=1 Tax=Rhodococcus sp. RCBS9 TaxID=3031999 RepID=UPI0024028B3A|nr:hypothetical protein [Rhodococcus sp. RCBS9]WEX02767.1 hypothetical protein P0M12_24425 [Rhodococcus sp. RCBS9]